jgi:hypothetical protein
MMPLLIHIDDYTLLLLRHFIIYIEPLSTLLILILLFSLLLPLLLMLPLLRHYDIIIAIIDIDTLF